MITKKNGRNFQFTKFSFIDFVLTDRRSLSGKRPKSASGKSSSCRFSLSAERNANTKATEHATFGFSFSILVFFLFQQNLNLIVCQRYGFFSVLAVIIRESSDNNSNESGFFETQDSQFICGCNGQVFWLNITTPRVTYKKYATRFRDVVVVLILRVCTFLHRFALRKMLFNQAVKDFFNFHAASLTYGGRGGVRSGVVESL